MLKDLSVSLLANDQFVFMQGDFIKVADRFGMNDECNCDQYRFKQGKRQYPRHSDEPKKDAN